MKESKSKKCFSRFTHRFQKDDMVAYMNALRLRPVFIQQNLATQVDNYINCMDGEKHSEGLQYVIEQLENSKIIVSSPAYDDLVLNRYQGVSKNTSIKIAYLILTDECNFNCSYCFMRREHQEGGTHFGAMSKETAIAAINTFARLSSLDQQDDERTIILYGGEPLLNFDVIKVVVQQVKQLKKINRLAKQTTINIVTNGSLLTDEVVQFLKASEIGIGISIDGADIVTNASRRYCDGSPTFPDIMRGIETCKRNGVTNYSLSVTITKASLENFDSTISFLRQYAISKNIGFNILMSEEDELKDEMEEYAHKASRFLLKAFNIFREDGIYEDRIMRKVNAFVDGKVHIFDCAATGANQIVVAPDGTIGVCHGFLGTKTFFSDNVLNESFDPDTNPNFQEWRKRSPINMTECLSCDAIGICGGGCPYNSFKTSSGNIWALDERFCIHSKKTLYWLIWDLYEKTQKTNNESK